MLDFIAALVNTVKIVLDGTEMAGGLSRVGKVLFCAGRRQNGGRLGPKGDKIGSSSACHNLIPAPQPDSPTQASQIYANEVAGAELSSPIRQAGML